MEIKEQITKRPGWTVIAGTAAIASIVGGLTLASANGGSDDLRDPISLRDTASYEAPAEITSEVPMFNAPIHGVGFDTALDSPLNSPAGGNGAASVASVASVASPNNSVSSPASTSADSFVSYDSPATVAPAPAYTAPDSVASPASVASVQSVASVDNSFNSI